VGMLWMFVVARFKLEPFQTEMNEIRAVSLWKDEDWFVAIVASAFFVSHLHMMSCIGYYAYTCGINKVFKLLTKEL
jgi:hypothetical protein